MNNELYHYGVPGMRWGKRNAKLADKNKKLAAKRIYVKKTKGPTSNSYIRTSKKIYLNNAKIKYNEARMKYKKNKNDKTKMAMKLAKHDLNRAKDIKRLGASKILGEKALKEVYGKLPTSTLLKISNKERAKAKTIKTIDNIGDTAMGVQLATLDVLTSVM